MRLGAYLKEGDLSLTAFAEQIGVSAEAVRRYVNAERIPEKQVMDRIVAATDGTVQPNDFYAAA